MSNFASYIEGLGFNTENGLVFFSNKNTWITLPARIKYILNIIQPFAFYCIDEKPFILFFSKPNSKEQEKRIHCQSWNFQPPIIIIEKYNGITVYNGYSINTQTGLLDILAKKAEEKFSFWNITSGQTWLEYKREFKKKRIDEFLLENIKEATFRLKSSAAKPFANQLILRLIFIRYLIDRGVDLAFEGISNYKDQAKQDLLDVILNREQLYNLFKHLKVAFNGNLFELYVNNTTGQTEKGIITQPDLNILYDLLAGRTNLNTGQASLFDLYDFNIIPIELISNIYERFIGGKQQRDDGAFYTPPFLVDYVLKHTIEPFLQNNSVCKVMDPACGSGIFLVETLRRIVENNLKGRAFIDNDKELVAYLGENIVGIDKNEEAIDVALFSLYITLLDYKDPKTLKEFKFPKLKGKTFLAEDFFNKELDVKLKQNTFDFIIGNPPWGSQPGDEKDPNNYHLQYVNEVNKSGILISDYQIAQSFIHRTKSFVHASTKCALIITSKVLYNIDAKNFRTKFLLKNCLIEQILELSTVRRQIFNKAIAPSAILFYQYVGNIKDTNNQILHISLKPNLFFEYFKIIVIEKYDQKEIWQGHFLENDWLWKVLVHGNILDFHFIKRLQNNNKYRSLKAILQELEVDSGAGYKIGKSNSKRGIEEIRNYKIVRGKKFIPLYIYKESLKTFEEEYPNAKLVDGIGKVEAYKAPHLLIKRGISKVPVVAFTNYECAFPNTVYGFHTTEEKANNLKAIGSIISTKIFSYLMFSLAPQWGVERDEVYLADYRSAPIPVLNENEIFELTSYFDLQTTNQEEASKLFSQKIIKQEILFDDKVAPLYGVFDLEKQLIDYNQTVAIPLFKGKRTPFSKLKAHKNNLFEVNQFEQYTQVFIDYFSEIFNEPGKYLQVDIYPDLKHYFAAIEFKIIPEKPKSIIQYPEPNQVIEIFKRFSIEKHNQYFYTQKDVINYEQDSFFIIKPNQYKNWHPAVAYLDLDEVIDNLLDAAKEQKNLNYV